MCRLKVSNNVKQTKQKKGKPLDILPQKVEWLSNFIMPQNIHKIITKSMRFVEKKADQVLQFQQRWDLPSKTNKKPYGCIEPFCTKTEFK